MGWARRSSLRKSASQTGSKTAAPNEGGREVYQGGPLGVSIPASKWWCSLLGGLGVTACGLNKVNSNRAPTSRSEDAARRRAAGNTCTLAAHLQLTNRLV